MRRLIFLLAACGGSGGSTPTPDAAKTPDAATVIDGPPGSFALTSPMLVEGAAFDAANTCNGANTSPAFVLANAPASTQSFALVLTDMSNALTHWVIYDIPATATGLPENIEKTYQPANVAGAHQTESFQAGSRGYMGPCPPNQHTYQFAVYALDAAALPGATMATTRAQALPIIQQHMVATATLTGTYAQP